MIEKFTATFPIWAIILSVIAFLAPEYFIGFKTAIIPLLVIIMFGMGMTLKFEDFKRVLSKPHIIGLGVLAQYLIMPFAAWLIAILLQLPIELMIGMVLVGSSAGGTASNVICYLARGDVALSISMTLCSTLLAIVLMPFLTWLYVGQTVPVPVAGMLYSILKIVLLPVLGGVLINSFLESRLDRIKPLFPFVSSLAIIVIIAIIVALNRDRLTSIGATLVIAVMLHNIIGLLSGYQLARLARQPVGICRTMAIEVGMQNSGLSVALAIKYFAPAAALPAALFSIWHNISGSLLASYWARQKKR
ncbi:MAG: bile acid:sodium symporter family protein [Gammaproteobacteria bacterium]|nr:bile acid:sodium symporter family protein [Gammaproteobacteria bacterium]MDH5777470.1 bile acid:sodium symporter family protein [Gammaproteobacteria bacterium]